MNAGAKSIAAVRQSSTLGVYGFRTAPLRAASGMTIAKVVAGTKTRIEMLT